MKPSLNFSPRGQVFNVMMNVVGARHHILFSRDNLIELSFMDYRRIYYLKYMLSMLSRGQGKEINQ